MNQPNDPAAVHAECQRIIHQARDLLIEACRQHDLACEETNCPHALGVAAFIAHALGVNTSARINLMEKGLDKYNRDCPGCTERN